MSPADHLAMRLLNTVARFALRAQPPMEARRTVKRWAGWLRQYDGIDDARRAAQMLAQRGTCLSRSLAIAARLPGAEVVIGADPRWSGTFTAHAWVEWQDHVIDNAAPCRREPIARF